MKTYNERTESIKRKARAKRDRRIIVWTASSVAAVLLVLTAVCSLPIFGESVPNINAYKNDEYYPLIQKINSGYQDNRYSVFGKLFERFNNGFGALDPAPDIFAPSDSDQSNKYEETTLNQVDGVIEGDVLKRSSAHAFYLKNGYDQNREQYLLLEVYSLDGSGTEVVSQTYIQAKDDTRFALNGDYLQGEMFLSADASRLTVICTCLNKQNAVYTTVISLDVSNVNDITEVNRVYVSGSYLSSRKIDGKLLVITNFIADRYKRSNYIDYSDKQTYIPQCGGVLGDSFISADNIYIPKECLQINYTVLALLDETSLNVYDSYAVFSYSQDVYVSQDYIVVMRNGYYYYDEAFDYGSEQQVSPSRLNVGVCELVALNYKNGFDKKGEIGLDGLVKDRYSMDEKDGILRVFTTAIHSQKYETSLVNASLYCVNLSSMQVAASKECFAPSGDEVKSARFDGNKAYVCTARRNTDPVFYFDLSDLNKITCVDTGEIEGFSENLIKFGDLLLGIGQGEHGSILKIELYKQSDDLFESNGVESVTKYEHNCIYSREYKAHFVDAEHGLVGLHIYDLDSDKVTNNPNANANKYLLLHFDGESLTQLYLDEFKSASDYVRAFYADNGVYVFGTKDFKYIEL